ncbi:MAG: 5-bromo-4-chloroindolyl phosphate hydrolysis family protein [Selenomonas sp.]|nr:5-bromo-4-chloroindolyl phosphate hydrolysis family protein [Selenomonas sp.]
MRNLRRFVQVGGVALMCIGMLMDFYIEKGSGMWVGLPGLFAIFAGFFLPKAKDVDGAARMKVHPLPSEALRQIPAEEQETYGALYEKAQQDYVAIEQAAAGLADEELRAELAGLQPISVRIMDYMGAHPEKIPLARKFVTYYQDRTAALVKEYLEFERTGLSTEQVEATKAKIRATLAAMDEAYTAEFEKLLSDKLLDVDAELKVMEQTLAADGIEDRTELERTADGGAESGAAGADGAAGSFAVDGAGMLKPDETLRPTGPRSWAERLADRAKDAAEQEQARREGRAAPWAGHPQAGRAHRGQGFGIGRGDMIRRPGSDLAIIPAPLYDDVRRQRILMSVLAIVLGTFGAHRFYQGRIGLGILYVLFCGTGLSTIVSLCEGIRYATMPLARFYEKVYRPVG